MLTANRGVPAYLYCKQRLHRSIVPQLLQKRPQCAQCAPALGFSFVPVKLKHCAYCRAVRRHISVAGR